MTAQFIKKPGNVFLTPEPVQVPNATHIGARFQDWVNVANSIASELPAPTPEPAPLPTIGEVFTAFLPQHIAKTRWSRYIVPGSASRVFDGTIFVYNDPCANFWTLHVIAKGLFSEIGIRLLKSAGVWEARIPIGVLTDKGFVDSGLASVENTLLANSSSAADVPPRKEVSGFRITGRMIKHAKEVKARHAAEKAYWDRWDVEAKRSVAMRLDAERIEQQAEADACDTSELGEKYGMQFSDFQTITGESKHLSYESLNDENGDWLEKCYWAFPTDSFWVAWRKAKNALKATGYETIKLAGIWLVYIWR